MILVNSLLLLLVVWANTGYGQAKRWCFPKTKVYQTTLEIKQLFCRSVGIPPAHLLKKARPRTSLPKPRMKNEDQVAKDVMKAYPGLFLTEAAVKNIQIKKKKLFPDIVIKGVKLRPMPKPGAQHDGDIYCPTYRQLEKAPDSLQNVHGEKKYIVHFEHVSVYQYVHKGTCGGGQSCHGACLQEKSINYLMVWKDDPDWPMGFEPFEIDAYCSCKNVSPLLKQN